MLELLEHESIEAQYPAYYTLCMCQDKLSQEAIRKINTFKSDPLHRRVLRKAQREYGISLECFPEK